MIKPEHYDMSGEEMEKDIIIDEVNKTGDLLKGRIDSMLSRLNSVSIEELKLIKDTVVGANEKFDNLAGSSEWTEALKKSNS